MPFELRDSIKSKLTDSNKMRQGGINVHTYVHRMPNEKRSLSQVGKKLRESSSVEGVDEGQSQLRSMQKNDFTMS